MEIAILLAVVGFASLARPKDAIQPLPDSTPTGQTPPTRPQGQIGEVLGLQVGGPGGLSAQGVHDIVQGAKDGDLLAAAKGVGEFAATEHGGGPVTQVVAPIVGVAVGATALAVAGGTAGIASMAASVAAGVAGATGPFAALVVVPIVVIMSIIGIVSAVESETRSAEYDVRAKRVADLLDQARTGKIDIRLVADQCQKDAVDGYGGTGFFFNGFIEDWLVPKTWQDTSGQYINIRDTLKTAYELSESCGDETVYSFLEAFWWISPPQLMRWCESKRWTPALATRWDNARAAQHEEAVQRMSEVQGAAVEWRKLRSRLGAALPQVPPEPPATAELPTAANGGALGNGVGAVGGTGGTTFPIDRGQLKPGKRIIDV